MGRMPRALHHVVCATTDAPALIEFLTDVVGMERRTDIVTSGHGTETLLGWPYVEQVTSTILGSGAFGLIDVLHVPEELADRIPVRGAVLSFGVRDVEVPLARCRERGMAVNGPVHIDSDDVEFLEASVRLGDVWIEFLQVLRSDEPTARAAG
jgi:catechol 2,3-dioxygenase-like lactoylglutathione lyase family enzyme